MEPLIDRFLIRIEGVDLRHFIYGSDDLSTVRGGGLAMLFAFLEEAESTTILASSTGDGTPSTQWKLDHRLVADSFKIISRGASTALATFEIDSTCTSASGMIAYEMAETVRRRIDHHFRRDELYRHAHFVVDVVPMRDGQYRVALEEVLAKNRWRQMRQASIRYPSPPSPEMQARIRTGGISPVCCIDGVSPVSKEEQKAGQWSAIGESVERRRSFGRDMRQDLVNRLGVTGAAALKFTNTFKEIASRGDDAPLSGKIAVLYADGNSFGALQRELARDPTSHEDFDSAMRKLRSALMERVVVQDLSKLGTEHGDAVYFTQDSSRGGSDHLTNGLIRFETLLWGGDELRWIVPAWLGWWLVSTFFEATRAWKLDNLGNQELSNSVGLVFCSAKAPISRIKTIGEQLAQEVKNIIKLKPEVGGYGFDPIENVQCGNRFAYQVFESFDHMGPDFARSRRHILGGADPRTPALDLTLPGDGASQMFRSFVQLRERVPRRRIHRIATLIAQGGDADAWESGAAWRHEALELLKELPRDVYALLKDWFAQCPPTPCAIHHSTGGAALVSCPDRDIANEMGSGGSPAGWLHLHELWDYLDAATEFSTSPAFEAKCAT